MRTQRRSERPGPHRAARALIVGVGNTLAGDDAAGPVVAGRFAGRPDVRVEVCHQLVPELAWDAAVADLVIFVDAATRGSRVRVRRLGPVRSRGPMTHVVDAAAVLGLSVALYGRMPRAFLVTIPGRRFEIGPGLSAACARQIPRAVGAVEELLRTVSSRPRSIVGLSSGYPMDKYNVRPMARAGPPYVGSGLSVGRMKR